MDGVLGDLNPEQRLAVTHGAGPLLVLAGVGTGKTTVIARRIAFLISEGMVERPSQLLVFTFSRWAAEEMLDRAYERVGYAALDAWVATFHSVCERILRENAPLVGLPVDFRVMDEWDQRVFVLDHLWKLPLEQLRPRALRYPMRMLGPLLSWIGRVKDEGVSPAGYRAWLGEAEDLEEDVRRLQQELANVYEAYQDLMAREGLVDFGDLILQAFRLLDAHPSLRTEYQARFPFILADEFQDTSRAQLRLVQLLGGHRCVTAVGDDDQAIYGFRGVPWDNLRAFLAHYPEARVVVLTRNYRSTQSILDGATRLISVNKHRLAALSERGELPYRISKLLTSEVVPQAGPEPTHRHFASVLDEAEFLARKAAAVAAEGVPHKEIAVLYRNRYRPEPYLRALSEHGVPWVLAGRSGEGLFDQPEVKLLLSFLRQVADPSDDQALYHLAGSEIYGTPGDELAHLTSTARRRHMPLHRVFALAVEEEGELSSEGRKALQTLLEHLRLSREGAASLPAGRVLYEYLTRHTGYLERLVQSADPSAGRKVEHIAALFEQVIRRLEGIGGGDRVPWLVGRLNELIGLGYNPLVGEAEPGADAVQVMTFHQSKGLEFEVVFLTGLAEDYMPGRARRPTFQIPAGLVPEELPPDVAHLEEQRRLFYVGMTRAKRVLFLLSSSDYRLPGEEPRKRPAKVSRFVMDALGPEGVAEADGPAPPAARIVRIARDPGRVEVVPDPAAQITLSHQRVDDYLTCPLKYRYVHVLQVPIAHHHTVVFGHAVHRAIQAYHMARAQGRVLTVDQVLEVLGNAWRTEGFLSAEHEAKMRAGAEEALRCFYAYEEGDDARPTYVERYFAFPEGAARVIGYWDRVDVEGEAARIIDYKTSLAGVSDADRKAKSSLQLAIYALAYERLYGDLPRELQLRFLTPEVIVGRSAPDARTLERARQAVRQVETGIRAEDFTPKPSLASCGPCAYRGICPAAKSV